VFGQRFSSGFPGFDNNISTAHYSFFLGQIHLTGARQHGLPRHTTRTRTRSRHRPTSSASTARLLSGISNLLLVRAVELDRHLLALVPLLALHLDLLLALVLVLVRRLDISAHTSHESVRLYDIYYGLRGSASRSQSHFELRFYTQFLNEYAQFLNEHTQFLNEHTQFLNEHTQFLNEHSS